MKYVRDIKLNFQNDYIEFYEWNISDKITYLKKVPVIKVSNKDYLSLKYNTIILDNTCIEKKNLLLATNGIELMGILLNKEGKLLKRSSILLNDTTEILNNFPIKEITKIIYKKNIKRFINKDSRIIKEKKIYIEEFLNNIKLPSDEYLLKYIHYEITNSIEKDINKVYEDILNIKNNNPSILYNSIKELVNNT